MKLARLRLALIACCLHGHVYASATSHDFMPCHQRAVAVLESCLNASPGYIHDECWGESKRVHHACYQQVHDKYRDDREKIEAARKLRAQRDAAPKSASQAQSKE